MNLTLLNNLIRTVIFASILEIQFIFGEMQIGSLFLFMVLLADQLIQCRSNLYLLSETKRNKKIVYLLVPTVLLYSGNAMLSSVLDSFALFQVSIILSSYIFYGLIAETQRITNIEKNSFFQSVGKYFVYFLGIWGINLLYIDRGISFLTVSVLVAFYTAFSASYYIYLIHDLYLKTFLKIVFVALIFGYLNYTLHGFLFDPYGVVNAVLFVGLTDLIISTFEHNYVKKFKPQVLQYKMLLAFLIIVLSVQIINTNAFPQKVGASNSDIVQASLLK